MYKKIQIYCSHWLYSGVSCGHFNFNSHICQECEKAPLINSVFVYGTLRAGEYFDLLYNFKNKRIEVFGATIKGTLYNIDDTFPGVKLNTDDTIYGEVHVYNLSDMNKIIKTIDSIENYNPRAPKSSWYIRKTCIANAKGGGTVITYVYECNIKSELKPKNIIKNGIYPYERR